MRRGAPAAAEVGEVPTKQLLLRPIANGAYHCRILKILVPGVELWSAFKKTSHSLPITLVVEKSKGVITPRRCRLVGSTTSSFHARFGKAVTGSLDKVNVNSWALG